MENRELYFKEPRLQMTIGGRLLVRLVTYAGYALTLIATAMFLAGDVRPLRAAGALLGLFLLSRIKSIGKAERDLVRVPRGRVNVASFLSPGSFSVLEWAFDRASLTGGNFYLYAAKRLIGRRDVREGLLRMDIKPTDLENKLDSFLRAAPSQKLDKKQLLERAASLAAGAFNAAYKTGGSQIEPKDLFSAVCASGDEAIGKIMKIFNIDPGDLENALLFSVGQSALSVFKSIPGNLAGLIGRPYKVRHRIMNRAWTARPTPYLDQFSEDLTDLARAGKAGFLVGHAQEYDRLVDVLSRPGRPNALMIGEPGSGKSSLTAHLAFEITKDRVPPALFDKRLVQLEIGSLVAGAAAGELQDRVKKILDEIVRAGNVILYIPDIHNLLKTAGGQGVSAADILVPAIKSSAFSVVGATYPPEYKQYIESNNDFAAAFEPIKVQELSEAEAAQFMVYDSLLLEREYKMIISFSAVKQAVTLARKYFRQKLLPASAEDLLKETLADVAGQKRKIVSADDVVAVAEKKINVPIHKAGQAEAAQLLNLEEVIHQRLIDQAEAVAAVSRSLREYRSGLARKGGPIATFLFVGPTGVGKTELSKILAGIQFGSAEMMARFDMSEFQEKSSVDRLLDNLTDAIRQKPYSLILLDEFEKAHADILNLFLQVFDDGRLTDSSGRTVDFQNTIIIATSNAHSDYIKSEIERGTPIKELSEQLKKKLTAYFKPELLNRFSNIIVFKPLSPSDIQAIAKIQLADLAATLRESQGVDINFDAEAAQQIAQLGFDPVFGARPLRNVISEKIRGPLSEMILRGEIASGGSIRVSFENEAFIFK